MSGLSKKIQIKKIQYFNLKTLRRKKFEEKIHMKKAIAIINLRRNKF